MLRKIATYSASNAIGVILGLISFPIMARLLSYTDFGLLGFFQPHLLILAGILKLGSQHSIIRFHSRITKSGTEESRVKFATNLLWFPILAGSVIAVLILVGLYVSNQYFEFETYDYLIIVACLSWSTAIFSVPQSFYVARKQASLHAITSIGSSALSLVLVLVVIVYIERSALGVFQARFVNGVLTSLIVLWLLWRRAPGKMASLNPPTIRESLAYGLVLLCNEFAVVLLAFVDRYMIVWLLGDFATLGVYSLGYNLAHYITLLLGKPFLNVFTPTINKAYEDEGSASVREIKLKAMQFVIYPSALVAVLLLTGGYEVVRILAGSDKLASAPIFVYVGVGFTFLPFMSTWAFGLTLERRSDLMLAATIGAVLTNVVCNIVFLPMYGIYGAVISTLVSYVVIIGLRLVWCPKDLRIDFPWKATALPLLLSGLLYSVATFTDLFGTEGTFVRLTVLGALAMVLYIIPAVFIDKNLSQVRRDVVAKYLSR